MVGAVYEGMRPMPEATSYLEIRLGGLRRRVSDIDALLSHSGRFEIPSDFPVEGIRRAQVDAEIIAAKLRDNVDEMRELLQAYLMGDNRTVQRLIRELGLSESDFQEQGGGIFWVVVIVGVLCCAGEAY
jgi:hypothetical protein